MKLTALLEKTDKLRNRIQRNWCTSKQLSRNAASLIYPAVPLSVQHEAIEDCTVAGYHIPSGTRLKTNISKIQHIWSNPNEFQPERFLTTQENVDVRGNHFELIPFGSGRRSCPGISFALQVVHLILARLLQGFDFKTPANAPVDMTESAGLTNLKATPLEVLCSNHPTPPSKFI
ncbi:hypothetical protein ACHQM5_023176 [Ranunculus cassubicifolius]